MLNFIRRVLGNGEKIAIGNKISMGVFIFSLIGCFDVLWESREYTKIEADKQDAYNKLTAEFSQLAEQNMQDTEITDLKAEIQTLKANLTEVEKEYAPYHTELANRQNAAAAKRDAKAKIDEDFKLQFSAWNGSHRKTVEYVKERMHNPKSFKHVETRYIDHAENGYRVIQMKYRGTNLYNAIVTNSIWVKVDLHGNVFEVIKNQ